jgi:thiamine phosphate synthase YjbQ (UPF0047 family)
MHAAPQEISLDINPSSRFDIIEISKLILEKLTFDHTLYHKATYTSFHTTAGYLEQSLVSRLHYEKERIASYINAFKQLFPLQADYQHDQLELRSELSDLERKSEPKNADSHLTFIGSGLKNCVTYLNRPETPVFFIDLDGIHEFGRRRRHSKVMFYNQEEVVYTHRVGVPVSKHMVDSINLRDPRLGYLDKITGLLNEYEIEQGRVDITLDPTEKHAGLTVNEYETLLMTHDLLEVLKNPLEFMGEKGRYIIHHPDRLAQRTKEYAKYDLVHIFNELIDAFHISQSALEKILSKFIAYPAERFLRVKRSVSFLVSNTHNGNYAEILRGKYQSPILVQWKPNSQQTRFLNLTITRFK